jgi:hypothetical protein
MPDEADESKIREVIRSGGYYLVDEANTEIMENG